jgi:tripartite-type tricarboxylate transporter receptor subunit TctC
MAHGSLVTSRRALLLAAPALLPFAARAQPAGRPARIIIGFPAGGSSDVVARLYAERLRGVIAPQVLVEGRVGAAGRIAVEAVRDADKDGSVILQTPASMLTLQPHLFPREVRYDAATDLAAVTTVCTFPFALAVPAAHPAQDFAGLVAWLRAQPAEVPFASPATGSAPHFLGIMLGQAVGARLTHVPYRGAVPAIQDLLGGRLPMFVGVLGDVSPHIGNGVRMLALSSPARHPRHPSVPTFAELGHPALNKQEWFAAFLPAGTPAAIVAALHAAYRAAAASPELVAALDRLDFTPGISESPAAFAAQVLQERTEWAEIVKASGFRPEA